MNDVFPMKPSGFEVDSIKDFGPKSKKKKKKKKKKDQSVALEHRTISFI